MFKIKFKKKIEITNQRLKFTRVGLIGRNNFRNTKILKKTTITWPKFYFDSSSK